MDLQLTERNLQGRPNLKTRAIMTSQPQHEHVPYTQRRDQRTASGKVWLLLEYHDDMRQLVRKQAERRYVTVLQKVLSPCMTMSLVWSTLHRASGVYTRNMAMA